MTFKKNQTPKIFLLLLQIFQICISLQDYHFDYMTYNQILTKISEFGQNYPQYIKIYNITNNDIPFPNIQSCGTQKCQFVYYIMTDFSQPIEKINKLPQILLIGGIHGNEIVGSNAIIYLTKYFLENIQNNETIKYYIQNRFTILYPMSNPYGFYNDLREEYEYGGYIYDPNRDFPYNLGNNQCFLTAAARVLNYIFSNYLIKLSISFHGGTNSIGYPWGSYNHLLSLIPTVSQRSPDNILMDEIAKVLSDTADENPAFNIEKYPFGVINEIVYPVNGGSEDWAYAAGWENQYSTSSVITRCESEFNLSSYNTSNIRTILYLIECDFFKEPQNNLSGWVSGLILKNYTNWGHVTRNIAASISLIDLALPYIKSVEIELNQLSINITWKGGGCINVDSTIFYWRFSNSSRDYNNISLYNSTEKLNSDNNIYKTVSQKGKGYWNDNSYKFSKFLTFQTEVEIDFVIMISCDKNWADLVIQIPSISPQSHLSNARTDSKYIYNHKDFQINSEKNVFSYANNVKVINKSNSSTPSTINYYSINLESKLIRCNPFEINNNFGIKNYLTYNYSDLLSFDQTISNLSILNGLVTIYGNIKDFIPSNLTSFIFQYGDISECDYVNLGKNLEIGQFNDNYEYFNDSFQKPFFFLGDQIPNTTKEITLSFHEKVDDINRFSDLVGRSIILRSFSVLNFENITNSPFYMSYLTFTQNQECQNKGENCFGTVLNDNGVCFLTNEDQFFDSLSNFIVKVIIHKKNSTDQIFLLVEAILNLKYMNSKYRGFSSLMIGNSQKENNFSINSNQNLNFLKTDIIVFPLLYTNALGNKLSISIFLDSNIIQLGVCDIVYLNSSFNTTEYIDNLNRKFPFSEKDQKNVNSIYELAFGIGIPLLVIMCLVICIVKRRKRKESEVFPNTLILETPKGIEIEGVKDMRTQEKKEVAHFEDLESGSKMLRNPFNEKEIPLEGLNSIKGDYFSKSCKNIEELKYFQNINNLSSPTSMKNIYNEKIYPKDYDDSINYNEKIFPIENNSNWHRKKNEDKPSDTPSNSSSELGQFVRVNKIKHYKNSNSVVLANIDKNENLFKSRNEINKSALYYEDAIMKKKEFQPKKIQEAYKKLNSLS